jgi:hypothetical protein
MSDADECLTADRQPTQRPQHMWINQGVWITSRRQLSVHDEVTGAEHELPAGQGISGEQRPTL